MLGLKLTTAAVATMFGAGTPAAPLVNKSLTAGAGSYAITGTVAALKRGIKLAAGAGAYSITGTDATLTPASWFTMAELGPVMTTDSNGWSGGTLRVFINKSACFMRGGDKVRVTIKASSSSALALDKVYIGHAASSGDAYDFDVTPVQLTFNSGSASVSLSSGQSITSDAVSFTPDATKNLIVSAHASGTTGFNQNNGGAVGYTQYSKAAADDAATVNATGYSSAANVATMVTKVECLRTTPSPGAHRYWRLYALYTTQNSMNIAEMEMRLTTSGADQTSGGTALSNPLLSGTAANSFDDNNSTTTHTDLATMPAAYIGYDFGSGVSKDIREFAVTANPANAAYSPQQMVFQYSDDGSAWSDAWYAKSFSTWSISEQRVFTRPY